MPPVSTSMRVLFVVLLAFGGTQALDLETLTSGAPGAVNCTPSTFPEDWLEVTNLINYTQWYSMGDADPSLIPDPVPFPWSLSATNTKAPGFQGGCISKSPSQPADCSGDSCFTYMEEFGIEWLQFATLDCVGSYPTPGLANFFTSPFPPPGNVTLAVTQQCKNYYYTGMYFAVTDEWGNKWALQTAQENFTTIEEWRANLDTVVWPPGWSAVYEVVVDGTEEQIPYLIGDHCVWLVLKDNNANAWHMYTYPSEGLMVGNDIVSNMDSCDRLDARYTAENLQQ